MNAPLSLFLTQFSASATSAVALNIAPASFVDENDVIRLPDPPTDAVDVDVDALLQRHAAEVASLRAAHEAALAEALACARSEWTATEGERLAQMLEGALAELRGFIADQTVAVLRPILRDALLDRVKGELIETLDKLLANPSEAGIGFRGPQDLRDAIRAARPDAAIDWIVSDSVDVTLFTSATRVETRLAEAFARIATAGA
jgi:hypothetical protein